MLYISCSLFFMPHALEILCMAVVLSADIPRLSQQCSFGIPEAVALPRTLVNQHESCAQCVRRVDTKDKNGLWSDVMFPKVDLQT